MRRLERYLSEGSPQLQHFAEITVSLAKLEPMKASGKKPWTIRSVLTPLGRILGHATRKGKISSNPMQRLERGERPKVERHEVPILSREDIGKLLAGSPERYRTILATAVLTGMRLSELLGLQ